MQPTGQLPPPSNLCLSHLQTPSTCELQVGGIKARQFLLLGVKESAFGQYDPQKLRAELNKVLQDLGFKESKIRSVVSQKGWSTLIEVDSDTAALWFANSGNSVDFCSMLGNEVAFKTRAFNILAFNTPLTIDLNNSKHREEINETNSLEENMISTIHWAKLLNRRSPNKPSAHLVLSFSSLEAVNRVISSRFIICNKKCHAEHMKQEPIRCLRCQGWNHLARECLAMISKCSNCMEHHTTEDCNDPLKRRCMSCNMGGHASWSRECPTFLRKVEEYNLRNPNNLLPFFPTSEPWTWSTGDTNYSHPPKSLALSKSGSNGEKAKSAPEYLPPIALATTVFKTS